MKYKENTLLVKTLGRFSVQWNQTFLIGGDSMHETQFVYLLQILLHAGKQGVSRLELEDTLFEGREIANRHHALQSVLYNAKKKLKQAGLPDCVYFERSSGIFYWTEQIPVCEDARMFEQACEAANRCKDTEEFLERCLKACYLYTGEFLAPFSGTILWAAQEAQRYHAMFKEVVKQTARLLLSEENYQQLCDLSYYASRVDPGACWEELAMEGLYKMGQYRKAQQFFDVTASYYAREWGGSPSERMLSLLDRITENSYLGSADIQAIEQKLYGIGNKRFEENQYSYQMFQGYFCLARRLAGQSGYHAQLLLCTLTPQTMQTPQMQQEDSGESDLAHAIAGSLQDQDIFTSYGKDSYLILLLRKNEQDFAAVRKQISYDPVLFRLSRKVSFQWAMVPLP